MVERTCRWGRHASHSLLQYISCAPIRRLQLQEWCRDPARRYAVPDYSDCSPDVHGGGWRCKVQITNAAGKVVLTEVGTAGSKKTASLNAAEMALRRIWRLDAGHRS